MKNFLGGQWLKLHASNAGDTGSIPGLRNEDPICHSVHPKEGK